eukprot:4961709-Pyramimonas_sp.AAC.1
MPRSKNVRGSSWLASALGLVAVIALSSIISSHNLLEVHPTPVAIPVVRARETTLESIQQPKP